MEQKKQRQNWGLSFGNLAIGFLLGIFLILAIGAAGSEDNSPGRYQCCAAGGDDLAVFVIDTQSGQTWRLGRSDAHNFGTPYAPKSVRRSITPMVE